MGLIDACTSNTMYDGCYHDSDCGSGYLCNDATGACYLPANDRGGEACTAPGDCPASYTCGTEGRCLPGDCFFHGCVSGFECQSSTGAWECSPGSAGASGNDDSSQAGAGGQGG
ncbi:MAG TPA: hypothetical protein VER96_22250 [Polyangiaceae bacterium]|nr:hypothetical protein [Polyangiaceae bacterium]